MGWVDGSRTALRDCTESTSRKPNKKPRRPEVGKGRTTMTYDIEYRGYRIRGNAASGYSIYHRDGTLISGQNYMSDAKAWVDGEIKEIALLGPRPQSRKTELTV
jgi:hypothetical protein